LFTFGKKDRDEALSKAQSQVSMISEDLDHLNNYLGMFSPSQETNNIMTRCAETRHALRCLSVALQDAQEPRGMLGLMKRPDEW